MKYTPIFKKTNAIMLCSALFASSLLFTAFSFIVENFSANILKVLSAAYFMLSVVLISRYLVFVYTYFADEYEFTITQNTKNYSKTVCRLYYSDIIKIEETKMFAKSENEQYNEKYNYCSTLFCKQSFTMVYKTDSGLGLIVFEPNKQFVKYIEQYIKNDIILD